MAGKRQAHIHSPVNKAADHEVTELIIQELVRNAGKAVQDHKQPDTAPDPSFTLQLSDETLSGSNLLAFQKFFDGEFQFDVFFESRSAQKELNGMCLIEYATSLASANAFLSRYPRRRNCFFFRII
jgi:mannosyl-oligosaccharide glucosidase